MNRTMLVIAMLGVGAAAGAAGALYITSSGAPAGAPARDGEAAPLYFCPMHPSMVSDKPGACPICHMRMVPMEQEDLDDRSGAVATGPPRRRLVYRSTMNPSEISDKPGKDSMGMEMEAVEVDEPPASRPPVEGLSAVRLTDQKRQLIGVRTAPVARQPLVRSIRTMGRVTFDETRLHHVHTKIGGWIETLHANATGELVRKGQPMLTIYSPELVASAQEYLLALRARERLSGTSLPSVRESGEYLVEGARRRLRLFDLTPGQIAELERTGDVPRTMTVYAPITGHIIARHVSQGDKIESGTNLLDIADLSRVWVLADIYEYELPFVRLGQRAVMTLSYQPGRSIEGRVDLIHPVLSEKTRSVKIRLEFHNPDLSLKPEMYADVSIESDMGEKLVIPDSAVISTGQRDIVFVDIGDGYFEPREIEVGLRVARSVEVRGGLSEGEIILTSGNFLVDSESKLKAALGAAAEAANRPSPIDPNAPAHRH